MSVELLDLRGRGAVVVRTFNLSAWEVKVGKSLWDQVQPSLQSEYQESWGYTEDPCLKK